MGMAPVHSKTEGMATYPVSLKGDGDGHLSNLFKRECGCQFLLRVMVWGWPSLHSFKRVGYCHLSHFSKG